MSKNRRKQIVRSSAVYIGATLFLACVKVALGILSSSQAMIADAVNYYSDVLIAGIILTGIVLANKEPDRKHPFGYGRIEYISELLMAMFVAYSGLMTIWSSFRNTLHPSEPHYTKAGIAVLAVTIIAKYLLSVYMIDVGKKMGSNATSTMGGASRKKALFSILTILVAGIYVLTSINLDPLLGTITGLFVAKGGFTLLFNTVSNILGNRYSYSDVKEIKDTVMAYDEVISVSDMVLHNYGPDIVQGSIHIEVDVNMSMDRLDTLQRRIVRKVKIKHGVVLTGISIYAVDTSDSESAALREEFREFALSQGAQSIHGFYKHPTLKYVSMDVVFDLENEKRFEGFNAICRYVEERLPGYTQEIVMDLNYTDV